MAINLQFKVKRMENITLIFSSVAIFLLAAVSIAQAVNLQISTSTARVRS
jgi:hypothetical protein